MNGSKTFDWSFRDGSGRVHRRVSRGPMDVAEMRRAAARLLREQTEQALDAGAADPRLELLDVTEGPDCDVPFGQPLRADAVPVRLDEYAHVSAD